MKILLKGYYGFGNLGDDILLLVSYKLLKELYPHAEIVVFSNSSAQNPDAKYPPGYNRYIRTLLNEEVEIIDWTYRGHFDLIFHGGGGVYFDECKGAFYFRQLNSLVELFEPVVSTKADRFIRKLLGKPLRISSRKTIGVGLGVGPFHLAAPSFFRKIAEIGRFDILIVRDEQSLDLLKKWRLNDKAIAGSDLAFLTDFWLPNDFEFPQKSDSRIAIILKGHYPTLYPHYKTLAGQLTREGYEVTFFAFDEHHDKDYIEYLQPEFTVKIWQPHRQKPAEFIGELWQAGFCLTDRAHGAILAAIGQTIPMIIRTSPKSDQIVDLLQLNLLLPVQPKMFYTLEDIMQTRKDEKEIRPVLTNTVEQNRNLIAGLIHNLKA